MSNDSAKNIPAVWLAEGQSSQRDMLQSLQALKAKSTLPFTIIASHRHNRPEIFEFADKVFVEPKDNDKNALPRWQFVLNHARDNNVKVLLTGRNSIDYEAHRDEFTKAGIRLLTGATSTQSLAAIDDKFAFMQHCQAHNVPVATAWRFETLAELQDLLAKHGNEPLCVKPVSGIFAQGFWQLDTGAVNAYDSFEHLYFTEDKKIHLEQFISAYQHSGMIKNKPIPMLLMPYLSGQEFSIDVVCENGEILAAITRHKMDKIQHIGLDDSVMIVVTPLIRAFGCDGIVSVQTKADVDGNHRILEINSRPSGGIDYTRHSGIDLTQIGLGYWLGLTPKPTLAAVRQQIKPCQVRAITVGVKIE
ncbi:ATP-grasp domain-containing protein [Psychrobacter ciconiae]|uniref:ATP-grasp domain-containing protein n=1 Tax=Psychrobacter ciconiae TaxID=1553449 RepID=UPI001919B04C|nr:ATP-grasp domain-containing protein [Psychrobacter ciconiae]